MDLSAFGMQKLILFILVLARTAGIFTLTPIFGSPQLPAHIKLLASVALAFVFVPTVHVAGSLPTDILPMTVIVAREALVGLVIGFVCTLVFSAIQMAGQLVDGQTGLSFATTVDPTNGTPGAVAARFHQLIAGMLFFAINAHHILIRGLYDSFQIAPIGQVAINPAVAGGVVDLFTALLVVAIRIAIPVVAAVFMADIALAVTARLVPQMNVLMVGFPLKLGVGIIGMIIALPIMVSMSTDTMGDMYRHTVQLLNIMVSK